MIQSNILSDFDMIESDIDSSQFFSYYPKYEYLDNLLTLENKKNINLFIDVKGCAPALYQDWGVKHLIQYSKTSPHLSLHPFHGMLKFIAFHKMYAMKRGININLYFFMEQGKSKYHLNIYHQYKENRDLGDFFGLDLETREYFYRILDKNYEICEYIINRIPNCSFYRLKYCEADFMPYYLMKNKISKDELEESLNIIYSRDKDMHQCLIFPNSYQYYKGQYSDKTSFINKDNCFSHWFKTECKNSKNCAEWFPLFLAIGGDAGDSIPGIKGIGPKYIVKYIDAIYDVYGGTAEKMYETVMSGKSVLSESVKYGKSVTIQKLFGNEDLLKRNMKLISYRALSEFIDARESIYSIGIKDYIDKISNNKEKIVNYSVLWQSMEKKGMIDTIDEKSVESCFLNNSK